MERETDFWEDIERQKKIKDTMKKYDKDGNNKLDKNELAVLLQVLSACRVSMSSTFAGHKQWKEL